MNEPFHIDSESISRDEMLERARALAPGEVLLVEAPGMNAIQVATTLQEVLSLGDDNPVAALGLSEAFLLARQSTFALVTYRLIELSQSVRARTQPGDPINWSQITLSSSLHTAGFRLSFRMEGPASPIKSMMRMILLERFAALIGSRQIQVSEPSDGVFVIEVRALESIDTDRPMVIR